MEQSEQGGTLIMALRGGNTTIGIRIETKEFLLGIMKSEQCRSYDEAIMKLASLVVNNEGE